MAKTEKYEPIYNIGAYEIQQYQQNRYPLFFLDKIVEARPGEYVHAYKHWTYDEWFFPAHFADEPNVPGFIQMETCAQTFIMTFLTIPEHKGKKTAFLSVNNLKFRQKIEPGDRVDLEAYLDSFKRGVAIGRVVATKDNAFAYGMDLSIGLPDIMQQYFPKGREKA